MPRLMYCWRCTMEIPMLDEAEWAVMQPLLGGAITETMAYMREHGVSREEAERHASALEKYKEITGVAETNILAIWHHRAADFGPPCAQCGRPLRTPRAGYCADCGAERVPEPPTPPAA